MPDSRKDRIYQIAIAAGVDPFFGTFDNRRIYARSGDVSAELPRFPVFDGEGWPERAGLALVSALALEGVKAHLGHALAKALGSLVEGRRKQGADVDEDVVEACARLLGEVVAIEVSRGPAGRVEDAIRVRLTIVPVGGEAVSVAALVKPGLFNGPKSPRRLPCGATVIERRARGVAP